MTVSTPGVKVAATKSRQALTFALEMALDRKRAGRDLAALREESRLTQAELVEKSGLSLRQIQRYEAGESMPRWKNLDRLADVLGDGVYEIVRDDPTDDVPVITPDPFDPNGDDRLARIEQAIVDLTTLVRGLQQQMDEFAQTPQASSRRRGAGGR